MKKILIIKSEFNMKIDKLNELKKKIDMDFKNNRPIILPAGFEYEVVEVGDIKYEEWFSLRLSKKSCWWNV